MKHKLVSSQTIRLFVTKKKKTIRLLVHILSLALISSVEFDHGYIAILMKEKNIY